jgi:DNA-binding MarR family transcriptional regulator
MYGPPIATFGLLTNHAHVLLCVARDPEMRLRDVADCVGITERAAHRIVCELESEGYLARRREGRRNVYEVARNRGLPHALERGARVSDLLAALAG